MKPVQSLARPFLAAALGISILPGWSVWGENPEEPINSVPVEAQQPERLNLSVTEAILFGLENNRSLRLERYNPRIRRTFEDEAKAAFDPVLSAEVSRQQSSSERLARSGAATEKSDASTTSGKASLEKPFPTGTTVSLDTSTSLTDSSLYSDEFSASRVGMTVTQSLLKGLGLDANLAEVRQSRLDTLASEYELRGFAESLVAQIEQTYWDYALSEREIQIVTESMRLAEQQMLETQGRIKFGQLAEIELAAAQAEVALRREALINARSALEKTRLGLLRLLNPPGPSPWQREIALRDLPAVPELRLDDVATHAAIALRMRPEMNQARLSVQRGDLEIIKTRNGLLPKLDLFISLGKTGYSNSFWESARSMDGKNYDLTAGLSFEYPLRNRESRALHGRALLTREQSVMAVENLAQLVELDVRSAYIEVNRAREQADATLATRKLQEEKLRAETEKFKVGRSTSLFVAQAQSDLLASQIGEVEVVVNYLKALVDLYRLEGSLLDRRGINAPGREAVDMSAGNRP